VSKKVGDTVPPRPRPSTPERATAIVGACHSCRHNSPADYNEQVGVLQPPPSAVNVTLPAFAAECRRLLHGARSWRSLSPARRLPLLLSIDGTDRRTDGRSTVAYVLYKLCGVSDNYVIDVRVCLKLCYYQKATTVDWKLQWVNALTLTTAILPELWRFSNIALFCGIHRVTD